MNEIVKKINEISVEQVHLLSTPALKEALSDTVQITAKYITLLSEIWKELESRGEDLSDLRTGIAYYLPLIAEKKLDASAVLAFAGQQLLLREIAYLPIEQQISLSEGAEIPLVTTTSDGEYKTVMKKASSLHSRFYHQVFDTGTIRTPNAQIEYIKSRNKTKKSKKQDVKTIKLNKNKGVVSFGRKEIKINDFIDGVAKVSGISREDAVEFLKLNDYV